MFRCIAVAIVASKDLAALECGTSKPGVDQGAEQPMAPSQNPPPCQKHRLVVHTESIFAQEGTPCCFCHPAGIEYNQTTDDIRDRGVAPANYSIDPTLLVRVCPLRHRALQERVAGALIRCHPTIE
jgi:hypothetical protein